MPVFQIRNGKAQHLDVAEFSLERDLHQFFENNLEELLSIRFVEREYEISAEAGRIDTLGIDESNRPVIIEYKLDSASDEILAQGLAYQTRLIKNRKHFDLLIKQKYQIEVDWKLTRLIFVAKDFTRRMRDAVETNQGVDLIRYTLIQNGLLVLDKVSGQQSWQKKIIPLKPQQETSEGITRYLASTKQELHEPFYQLQKRILSLSGVEEVIQQKTGITYYVIKAIARFEFGKSYINLLLKSGAANNDSAKRLKDITRNDWGFPFLFKITEPEDIEYAFKLIEAAYQAAT